VTQIKNNQQISLHCRPDGRIFNSSEGKTPTTTGDKKMNTTNHQVDFCGKDQNWNNGSTTYWFIVDGETFGVVESEGDSCVVDCDGCPGNAPDSVIDALDGAVTHELRDF